MAVWSGGRYDTTFCNRGEKESKLVAVATAHTHEEHLRKRGRCDEDKLRVRERASEPLWVSDLLCGGTQVEVPCGGVQGAVGAQVGRGSGGEDPHGVLRAPC